MHNTYEHNNNKTAKTCLPVLRLHVIVLKPWV